MIAKEIIRSHLTYICDEMYKSRKMTDPTCFLCEYESEIKLMMIDYAKQEAKRHNKQIEKLKFMIDNGLGWDDMDITYPHEL